MPCSCAKNVETAFVLGIVLAVLSFLSCLPFFFDPSQEVKIVGIKVPTLVGIIAGILGVMTHCILIFGAHKRHSTTILVWKVLASLECILAQILAVLIFFLLLVIPLMFEIVPPMHYVMEIVAIFIFISVYIILLIWTIIVAENARKEIKADGSDLELGSI